MKKILVVIMCIAVVLSTCIACSQAPTPAASSAAVASVAPTASAAPAASEEASASSKTLKIFYSSAIYAAPYAAPLDATYMEEAKARGWDLTIVDGKFDGQVQLDQITTAIAQKYDAIIYTPADVASSINIVKKLVDSKIPFIVQNSKVDDSVKDQVHYVGVNVYDQAVQAANVVKKNFPDGCKIAMIEGVSGTFGQIERAGGFVDTLKDDPKYEIIVRQPADWDPAKAMTVMEDFISAYGDKIQVVYTHDDGMFQGAIQAATDMNVADKYFWVSVGANRAGMAAVKEGKLTCTISQSPIEEAKLGAKTLATLLSGGSVPAESYMENIPVTKDNADQFPDPGW